MRILTAVLAVTFSVTGTAFAEDGAIIGSSQESLQADDDHRPALFVSDVRGLDMADPAFARSHAAAMESGAVSNEDAARQPAHGSRKKAAIIGGAIGAGIGVVTSRFSDCPSASTSCPGVRVAGLVVAIAVGAAVGVGFHDGPGGRRRPTHAHAANSEGRLHADSQSPPSNSRERGSATWELTRSA